MRPPVKPEAWFCEPKRFGFWSHSKWLLAEHAELVDPLVFLLLVLDVLADDSSL